MALFLGFAQMHVPTLMILDSYFAQNDPQYETNKKNKRTIMLVISFLLSLFWGVTPLFGWPKMTFEPIKLSCAVYEANPDMLYIIYILCCLFFFEIGPLLIVIYCKVYTKDKNTPSSRV